jgi:hypothetical protein
MVFFEKLKDVTKGTLLYGSLFSQKSKRARKGEIKFRRRK